LCLWIVAFVGYSEPEEKNRDCLVDARTSNRIIAVESRLLKFSGVRSQPHFVL